MVDRVSKEFKNVIVVVNSSNAMELGWLDQYDILKPPFCSGAPGELGFDSPKILNGEVNPSDIWRILMFTICSQHLDGQQLAALRIVWNVDTDGDA